VVDQAAQRLGAFGLRDRDDIVVDERIIPTPLRY